MTLPLLIKREFKEYAEKHRLSPQEQEKLMAIVEAVYQKSTYDPEEPVGVVSAQSLSEPATQMSVSPLEKIILKRNGVISIVEIGEFTDKLVKELGKKVNGWDVCDISSAGVYVPSITADEKIKWSLVKACSRHSSPKHLVRIVTASGREITATDSHSFVVRKNNRIVPVSGKDLACGDRIPCMKFLPENCASVLELKDLVREGTAEAAKKPLPEKLEMNEQLGWVFGAYLAEGNCTKNYASFSNVNEQFLSRIREFARAFGFTFNEYDNFRGFARGHDIRINSTHLSRLLEKTCGTGSRNKKVPDFAYTANENFVSGLLRGYFDGDGNVHSERKMIRASSNSKELLDGICILLARFGIFAYKKKSKSQHLLLIPYKHAPAFLEKIGFTIPKKREGLEKMANLAKNYWNNKSQDFTDMISGFDDLFLRAAKKLGYPTRYVNNFTKRQKIGRTALYRYIKLFKRLASEKNIDISAELRLMRRMFSSDVIWDEIASIEPIKSDFEYVYDLTVEGTETFTTFEGIVTHNTMRTYHFAGTAGIQVTLGLPRMIEIFDARKEPRTPTMTIHIDKENHSIEQVKKIAEQIKEVKLKDIVISNVIDLTDMWIKCRLDPAKVKEFDIDPSSLPKKIKLRGAEASYEGGNLTLKSKNLDIRALYKMKYQLLETHIKGIKGVSQVVVTKEEEEWVINTLGSNLKQVFEIEGVDYARSFCNNMFEMYEVLGIEAGRTAIINQAQYTMEEQGLGVDVRYIMLLADLMTVDGEIKAIGRYGISGQKASVLVRASFEETKKHLVAASVRGEKDQLKGAIENIILNQLAPIGTGAFDLVGRIPEGAVAGEEEEEPKIERKKAAKPPSGEKSKPAKRAAKEKAAKKEKKAKKAEKPRKSAKKAKK